MHHDRIPFGDLLQHVARPSCGVEKILRDDLEPVDGRPLAQDMRKMDAPQTYAEAKMADVAFQGRAFRVFRGHWSFATSAGVAGALNDRSTLSFGSVEAP